MAKKQLPLAEAYPLQWPQGYPRTKKRRSAAFKTPMGAARDGLLDELRLMRASQVVISTNLQTYRRSGRDIPYADQTRANEDPAVAVYFLWKPPGASNRDGSEKEQYVLACDRWKAIEDNMQALRKTVEALRGIERWGVSEMLRRAFTGFKALPESGSGRPWWQTLSISKTASEKEIRQAFRKKAQQVHPDKGGSIEQWSEIQEAYQQAMQAVGAEL